ncbi:MAG: VOC family protein [Microbacterium sp.]|jgi:catechol 2,3-dioxygenase-like lactoylglutathione lyase family enzyme|nr:VOC family protein [Microbacterium sp.]
MELALEVIVLPVSDVDRSKDFYSRLGFREDADFATERGLRVVQFTPPGSGASIIFGERLTNAQAGTVRGLHLVTPDLASARAELIERGVDVSPIWHDADGVFHWAGRENRVDGPSGQYHSYSSYVSFDDPDGNEWIIQQIIDRLPGR